MKTYAMVKNGIVENIIVWDGESNLPVEQMVVIERAEAAIIGEPWSAAMIASPTIEENTIPITQV